MNKINFKDRRTAVIITAILIVVSFAGGGARSLNALKSSASGVFINGANGDGMGIRRELDRRVEYSRNLLTIAERYISGDDAAVRLDNAANALAGSKNIAGQSKTNRELTEAAAALYDRLETEELSDTDARLRESVFADLKARNNIILNDKYNEAAWAYNRKLNAFPASLIKTLRLASELPLF